MTQKKVIVSDCVRRDLEIITDMVMQMTSADFAERYARRIEAEISKLSYMAMVLPRCGWLLPLHYHPEAKTMPVGKRKLTVIFHIEGDFVIVDKILPSAMVTY